MQRFEDMGKRGATMATIRTILVPVDFSECSDVAVRYAVDLAGTLGARIDVLHAWTPPAELNPVLAQLAIRDPEHGGERSLSEFVEAQAAVALDNVVARLECDKVPVRGLLEAGPAKRTIVQLAEMSGYDLIIMGTHGRTGLSHLLMGSVAEWVVRHANVPVLTIRTKRGAAAASDSGVDEKT